MNDDGHVLPAAEEFSHHLATHSAADTAGLGRGLAELLQGGELILLHGALGAGKTCLVQGVCAGLSVEGDVLSPTYTLVNTYAGALTVHHLDFYRVDPEHDLDDIGVPEVLDDIWSGQAVGLVEWPGSLLPALAGQPYLELLATAGAGTGSRRWHLRGWPSVPEAWSDFFETGGESPC